VNLKIFYNNKFDIFYINNKKKIDERLPFKFYIFNNVLIKILNEFIFNNIINNFIDNI